MAEPATHPEDSSGRGGAGTAGLHGGACSAPAAAGATGGAVASRRSPPAAGWERGRGASLAARIGAAAAAAARQARSEQRAQCTPSTSSAPVAAARQRSSVAPRRTCSPGPCTRAQVRLSTNFWSRQHQHGASSPASAQLWTAVDGMTHYHPGPLACQGLVRSCCSALPRLAAWPLYSTEQPAARRISAQHTCKHSPAGSMDNPPRA
jgi:hypothetical protein